MKKPVLVIMAAGMGSRYGGLKQIDKIDAAGHIIMDFSIFDAKRAGFEKVVFIIKRENLELFKEVIGETPVEYIVNVRVEHALKLLAEDEFSITEIAEQSGFGSVAYMTRVFKQKLGVSPGKCKPRYE